MISLSSNNAISSKIRGKFGRRLTVKNYNDLLALKNVPQIAEYLKTNTYFGDKLSKVNTSNIHRGYLEELLNSKYMDDWFAVCNYESSGDSPFFENVIIRGEITRILEFIRLLKAGSEQEFILTVPGFFTSHSNIDFYSFAKVRTGKELLECLKDTRYYSLLKPYLDNEFEEYDYTKIEVLMYKYYYARMFRYIQKKTKGSAKTELYSLYAQRVDLLNIDKVLRLKNNFGYDSSYIKSCLYDCFYKISKKQLFEMADASTYDEAIRVLKTSYYGKFLRTDNQFDFENDMTKLMFKLVVKNIRYSVNPIVTLASYIIWSEIELENVTSIIEGVRYGVTAEKINSILVEEKSEQGTHTN